MRKLFKALESELEEFVNQRDDLVMIASANDNDAPILLKLLRDIEQKQGTDVFLLFADDFVQPGAYVSVIAERLREEHRMACEALKEDGKPPLRAMPDDIFNAALPPLDRLWKAICFARSLIPGEGGHRLVWVACPQKIADRREYLRLVTCFVPRGMIQPWMRGVRLVFRDQPDSLDFAPGLARAPRTRVLPVDLGPAAMEKSMRDDVEDDGLPLEDRMQSLAMLASLDSAHGRTDDAIAKYKVLLGHYQSTNNQPMQAFVLNAFGDMFQRKGELDRAQYWYECAVPPVVESKDPVLMAAVVKNLGEVSYKRQQFSDAEQYFDGLDRLAAHNLDPETKVQAIEWKGLSQEKQGRVREAVASWDGAATLCRSIGLPPLLKKILEHQERGYRALGERDRARAVRAEIDASDREEVPA